MLREGEEGFNEPWLEENPDRTKNSRKRKKPKGVKRVGPLK